MGRYLDEILQSGICPTCRKPKRDIDEQYSYGVYAGVMCGDCARTKYRDGCGLLDGRQGSPADLDEPYEEEECILSDDYDDTVHFCPECERPNQFGQVCEACRDDIRRETGKEIL